MQDLDSMKSLGATKLISLIRTGYRIRQYKRNRHNNYQWLIDRDAKHFSTHHPTFDAATVSSFIEWVAENPQEVETWLVQRSPAVVSKLAITWKSRLHPEPEKILLDKAKDKAGLIDYCTHFGILIPDSSKVTLKAAFEQDAWREKRYVQKMEETKRNLKGFLIQMLNLGQINKEQTVSEVLENL
jgi:hypothetical protein